ncbi:hypothetical protein QR680_006331 [Steinernema hermaphroditum]|uniref:Transcription factor AP-2 C-terminal domain-containing protein n=1 Tax=Steinernema hermaphroditum TaxID=289476 RepID=A0AA39HXA5_9BILA|nr:hypothetical protein QR680_006331 [Steinernema hermaphroditum]
MSPTGPPDNNFAPNGFAPPPGTPYDAAMYQQYQMNMLYQQYQQMMPQMSLPMHMPQMPQMGQVPTMPQMGQVPTMPQMGQVPTMPQIPQMPQNMPFPAMPSNFQNPMNMAPSQPALPPSPPSTSTHDPTPTVESKLFPIKVQNRCQLQGDNKKYDVGVEEVSRRILGPEGMNATTLETYLRVPKTKKDIEGFREELSRINLRITTKKRKVTENTCYSAITEGEGVDFAKAFAGILKEVQLAKVVGTELAKTSHKYPVVFANCRVFIEHFLNTFPREKIPDKTSPFYDLFCMTHAFGIEALKAILATASEIFSEAQSYNPSLNFSQNSMNGIYMGSMFCQETQNINMMLNQNPGYAPKEPENEAEYYVVPARFTLPGMNHSYNVRMPEIKRRLDHPELMNSSTLTVFLRRGKKKEGGKRLREELEKHNINLSSGKRKARPHTVFTALTESEAQIMADHFGVLLKDYLKSPIAYFRNQVRQHGTFTPQVLQSINGAFSSLIAILAADPSELTDKKPTQSRMTLPLDVQRAFSQLSSLTHGFGVFALKEGLEACLPLTEC